jgi:hypothetical protein
MRQALGWMAVVVLLCAARAAASENPPDARLQKVNDETTRSLMEAYYTHLLAGQGRATALREAMRSLRAKEPHPYYWAPFIALGRDAPLRNLLPTPQGPSHP